MIEWLPWLPSKSYYTNLKFFETLKDTPNPSKGFRFVAFLVLEILGGSFSTPPWCLVWVPKLLVPGGLRQKCVLLPENSLWPTSKYPQIKTSFVIGSLCLLSKCQVEITEFKHRHEHGIIFCSYDINLSLHQCEPFLFFWLMESSN